MSTVGSGGRVDPCSPRRAPTATMLEMLQDAVGQEAAARCAHMAVAVAGLAGDVEALGLEQVEPVAGAGHRDVEQPPLLLDVLRPVGRHVRGDAAVDQVQHEHRLPFLALGRMDGRQDQIVLVLVRRAGGPASGRGRVQGQLGQEALAARHGGGQPLELVEIGAPAGGEVVELVEQRVVERPHQAELRRPGCVAQARHHLGQPRPELGSRRRRPHARQRRQLPGDRVEATPWRSPGQRRAGAAAPGTPPPGRAGSRPSAASPARP